MSVVIFCALLICYYIIHIQSRVSPRTHLVCHRRKHFMKWSDRKVLLSEFKLAERDGRTRVTPNVPEEISSIPPQIVQKTSPLSTIYNLWIYKNTRLHPPSVRQKFACRVTGSVATGNRTSVRGRGGEGGEKQYIYCTCHNMHNLSSFMIIK